MTGTARRAFRLTVSPGEARGVTKREEWITRSGLLVRVVAVVNSDRDTPAGTAHYVEQYELKLRSLDPQS